MCLLLYGIFGVTNLLTKIDAHTLHLRADVPYITGKLLLQAPDLPLKGGLDIKNLSAGSCRDLVNGVILGDAHAAQFIDAIG